MLRTRLTSSIYREMRFYLTIVLGQEERVVGMERAERMTKNLK